MHLTLPKIRREEAESGPCGHADTQGAHSEEQGNLRWQWSCEDPRLGCASKVWRQDQHGPGGYKQHTAPKSKVRKTHASGRRHAGKHPGLMWQGLTAYRRGGGLRLGGCNGSADRSFPIDPRTLSSPLGENLCSFCMNRPSGCITVDRDLLARLWRLCRGAQSHASWRYLVDNIGRCIHMQGFGVDSRPAASAH